MEFSSLTLTLGRYFLCAYILSQFRAYPGSALLSSASPVPPGSTLHAANNSFWKSDDGTFAIGFIQVSRDTFVMAIWYNKLPSKDIVWSARSTGRNEDLEVSNKATISLSIDGNLDLVDSGHTVWSTNTVSMAVTGASMLSTGNFVVFNNSGNVWESFHHPTNTLLPNQQFSSTLTNGYYLLETYDRGIRLNYTYPRVFDDRLTDPSYWDYSPGDINYEVDKPIILTLSPSGSLRFHDVFGNNSTKLVDFAEEQPEIVNRRLSLDNDGNARVYGLNSSTNSWVILWQAVLAECNIRARCGANAICTYMPNPTCICVPGFYMQNNSCIQRTPVGCASNIPKEKLTIISLYYTDFYSNDDNDLQSVSMEACKQNCLEQCKCVAALYFLDGQGRCLLKNQLSNGRQSPHITYVVFLKLSSDYHNDNITLFPQDLSSYATVYKSSFFKDTSVHSPPWFPAKYGIALLCVALAELCCLSVGFWRYLRLRSKLPTILQHGWMNSMPIRFSYEQLKLASDNFSHEIGAGGFGKIYKGKLHDGTIVAIKKLELANHGEEQFKAEVTTMGKIHHINLVRLFGYCLEGSHRLLVHQYISNGSLDQFLFFSNHDHTCNWNTRFGIALGIARGIMYLHEQCQECILHFDIKPQNVLLDENFIPKICDFGLAKLISREMVTSISTIRGTRGYLAPEWTGNQPITTKADVYSYGMLLFEVLSGRRNLVITNSAIESNKCYFPEWAVEKLQYGDLEAMVDPRVGKEVDWVQFGRSMKVALWCIQLDPTRRFEMGKVVQMLEGNMDVPSPPDCSSISIRS